MNSRMDQLKQSATGRWRTIIPAITQVDSVVFDGKNRPCPKCGGKDRFAAFKDFNETGGVHCRQCHNKDSKPISGDGIATIQWLYDCSCCEAMGLIEQSVGIQRRNDSSTLLADLCRQKNIAVESAMAYGATVARRGRTPVVRFPVYDSTGKPSSYSDVSPHAKGKLNKGLLQKGGKAGLHFPNRIPKSGETWVFVEGVKDAAALHGLGFLSAGITGNRLPATNGQDSKSFESLFDGCDVILVPDLDRQSFRGFADLGRRLAETANSIRVARLPGKVTPTKGRDIRDAIKELGGKAIKLLIENGTVFDAQLLTENRGSVVLNIEQQNEKTVADQTIKCLAMHGENLPAIERVYQKDGSLFAVSFESNFPVMYRLDSSGLRERISAAVDLIEIGESKGLQIECIKRPPEWLYKAILSRKSYEFVPVISGVTNSPTIREDGTIVQRQGFDPASGILFASDTQYPVVPESPTKSDAIVASELLSEIVRDFPFRNEAAKSVWLALVLTIIARPAIRGNIPLFAISSNVRGSGKSKLCDVATIIASSRVVSRRSLPGTDEETRKTITTICRESPQAVLFDNIAEFVGNASLDAVLTSERWNDRILGKSESTGDMIWRTVLMATGNNLCFRADTTRRVVLCELDSQVENPEDRADFVHADLEGHVMANQPRLAVAALTMLRAFFEAGKPYQGHRLGSFENWSEIVCGCLTFAGLPNPLETVKIARQQDTTTEILSLLLNGLAVGGVDGLTAKEILDGISGDSKFECWDSLRAGFAELTGSVTTRKIGKILSGFQGRVLGGRRIMKWKGRSGCAKWAVESLKGVESSTAATNASNQPIAVHC